MVEHDAKTDTQFVGRVIEDRYVIKERIGGGGQGGVYRGTDRKYERDVAVKIIPINSGREEIVQKKRFQDEVKFLGRLRHPRIVTLHAHGRYESENGPFYLVMEYIEGRSLHAAIKKEAGLDPLHTINIVVAILEGLTELHAEEIYHRDIKPKNIMLQRTRGDEKEFVRIVDLGIAKKIEISGEDEERTRLGAVPGTTRYMPPELLEVTSRERPPVGPFTDIYSLGITWYEMLVGGSFSPTDKTRSGFVGWQAWHVRRREEERAIELPREVELPGGVREIWQRMVELDYRKRYGQVATVLKELRDLKPKHSAAYRRAAEAPGYMTVGSKNEGEEATAFEAIPGAGKVKKETEQAGAAEAENTAAEWVRERPQTDESLEEPTSNERPTNRPATEENTSAERPASRERKPTERMEAVETRQADSQEHADTILDEGSKGGTQEVRAEHIVEEHEDARILSGGDYAEQAATREHEGQAKRTRRMEASEREALAAETGGTELNAVTAEERPDQRQLSTVNLTDEKRESEETPNSGLLKVTVLVALVALGATLSAWQLGLSGATRGEPSTLQADAKAAENRAETIMPTSGQEGEGEVGKEPMMDFGAKGPSAPPREQKEPADEPEQAARAESKTDDSPASTVAKPKEPGRKATGRTDPQKTKDEKKREEQAEKAPPEKKVGAKGDEEAGNEEDDRKVDPAAEGAASKNEDETRKLKAWPVE